MSAVRRVVTGREKPRADRTHRPHVMPTPRPPRGQPVPQPAMPVSAWAIGALQRAGETVRCARDWTTPPGALAPCSGTTPTPR
jgi:hypothetical protein